MGIYKSKNRLWKRKWIWKQRFCIKNFINGKEYEYKFTKQEDGNILWEGTFENCKFGESFVNPPGGPYIKVG